MEVNLNSRSGIEVKLDYKKTVCTIVQLKDETK